jgi:Occludin homology domain
MPIQAMRE